MKIGIDARYAEGNLAGIGHYIHRLVLGLAGKGHQVVLFYSRNPKFKIDEQNINSIVLPSNNRYLFEQYLLPKSLKKENTQLYHAAENLGIPIYCPCPSVLTVHDIIPLLFPNYFSFSRVPFLSKTSYFLRTAASLFRAHKIIADSKFTKECLIKEFNVSPEKITVIYLGVEKEDKGGKLPEELIRRKYILNNGGIDIRKNLDRLIRAFAQISPRFDDLKLVITGENQVIKPKLAKLAQALGIGGKVIFTGYVEEKTLWALRSNARCLCLPSEIEGFGLPVLDGMAAGVPVVASNNSSIPEIADEAVMLVNPLSVEEIAGGIEKVLINKTFSEGLVKNGLAHVKEFTWEKTVNQTIKIYENVLA